MENRQKPADLQISNRQSAIGNIRRPPFIIHHYQTLGSTSEHLKGMDDAPEFTCIVADEQLAGRGRNGRPWYSKPGDGLYLSILLYPKAFPSKTPLLSLTTGISVAEVLIGRGVDGVDIKWPNDVLINERKVCGILIEGASAGSNRHRLILGIGVNLNHQSFPLDLSLTATSLAIETGRRSIVAEFCDLLLERVAHWYGIWSRGEEQAIITRWQELSSYARGKRVIVTLDDGQITGETAGLTETGALLVKTGDGQLKIIYAGEVMKLRTLQHSTR
jgi:BirA family transcriptional regulator, biotin operon repressor / biotin---[acetyl-CoA-carboxylase] ligase